MDSKPRWLVVGGCPRSGTSLLNFLLNTHPNIYLTNEHSLSRLLKRVGDIFDREKSLVQYQPRIKGDKEFWTEDDVKEITLSADKCTIAVMEALYKAHFQSDDECTKPYYFGDKYPEYYISNFERLERWLEPLYVIHVTRNPIDVVASMLQRASWTKRGEDYWRGPSDEIAACQAWADAWNFFQRRAVDKSGFIQFHQIKYESLLAEPERELYEICRFLELEFDFNLQTIAKPTYSRPNPFLDKSRQAVQKLLPGISENWGLPINDLGEKFPQLNVVGKKDEKKLKGSIRFINSLLRPFGLEVKKRRVLR